MTCCMFISKYIIILIVEVIDMMPNKIVGTWKYSGYTLILVYGLQNWGSKYKEDNIAFVR